MNSLNILSAKVSPPPSPGPSRSNSLSSIGLALASGDEPRRKEALALDASSRAGDTLSAEPDAAFPDKGDDGRMILDEHTPLLSHGDPKGVGARPWHYLPKRIASAILDSIRWVLSTLAAPSVYVMACFCDENGNFAPLLQLKRLFGLQRGPARKLTVDACEATSADEKAGSQLDSHGGHVRAFSLAARPTGGTGSSSSGLSSESDSELERLGENDNPNAGSGHGHSRSARSSEEIAPARRSIRIKLHNDDATRQRKHRKDPSGSARTERDAKDISAQLKSPTSPAGALTKYPKMPAPPRPLIPRRQPSYLNVEPTDKAHQKTLILDLDETLIHSMSKGGRMSTGHMVEVRLNTTYVGASGQASIGPQHPILYYVHKRPHCDDFLRRVCKWYNLVVFTASVQEYADPVIDWLESERKFFSQRLYRQHCTFRHGAFIKDLSSVEPDLSKVMILDNSPLSYMFHEDNAIPIQGWINDPTDNDLLHLVPLLEGLQYVSDVRALLALRGGEDGQHMA